ncbi:MAG: sigma-70 family RNA polymerase sigma factor [Bacteroidota bacterium]
MKPVPERAEPSEIRALVQEFLRTRSEDLFRSLYRDCTPRLYQFVWRMTGRRTEDANDIVQETWVRAVERMHEFRWNSTLNTWLTGIALNCCREFNRRRPERDLQPAVESISAIVRPIHEKVDLETAIGLLPDGYRTVLILHDIEGLQHAEIAELLDIEIGSSKSQLSRARASIRTMLRPHGTTEYIDE